VDGLVDLRAGAVVGRDNQRAIGRLGILLGNSRNAVFVTWHLMDAALPLHTGNSLSHLAARKLLDGLFQFRIALPDNLLQLHRLHARVLELGKDAARLDGFMLAVSPTSKTRSFGCRRRTNSCICLVDASELSSMT